MPNYSKAELSSPTIDLDLSIIIVSYNTRDMTLECIDSVLRETTTARYEIIVVDNASADGSAEAIRIKYPTIRLIETGENIGFARANNLAAVSATGRRILLLNPDTVILNHAIDSLYEFALENPECRIWGGRTVFGNGALNPQSCWGRMTLWSTFCNVLGLSQLKGSMFFNPEEYGRWQRDSIRTVDIVTGCFFLIDSDLWKQLKGFDPIFFMYAEEADLCLRAQRFGAKPKINPSATIIHYGGASERDRVDQKIKLLAGKNTLIRRHWSAPTYFAGRLLFLMFPLTRYIGYSTLGVPVAQRRPQRYRPDLA